MKQYKKKWGLSVIRSALRRHRLRCEYEDVSIAPITPALPGVDSIAPITSALPDVDQYPTVLAPWGVVWILENSRIVLGSGRAVTRVTYPMFPGSTLASGCSATILQRQPPPLKDCGNRAEIDQAWCNFIQVARMYVSMATWQVPRPGSSDDDE
jgi:hypothetical protein